MTERTAYAVWTRWKVRLSSSVGTASGPPPPPAPLDPGGIEKVPVRFYFHMVAGLFGMLAPRRLRPALARLLANPALVAPPEMLAPMMLAMRSWKPTGRPAAPPFTDEELRAVTVPALVLIGARSALLRPRRVLARVNALLPNVRAEIVAGAGHGLTLECPELVNERLLAFFAATEAERAAG
ncbi:alpha/beta fold hydrolase [Kitasatospora sp. NPDC059673]|uniref:alpha/beta fold hydrolase n=1 Tax=Kitasatospora sp. NPDC059673 TaxID=3346901 RepID=UPI0036C06149